MRTLYIALAGIVSAGAFLFPTDASARLLSTRQMIDSPIHRSEDFGKYDSEFDRVIHDVQLKGTKGDIHSLLVIKDGKLIYENYPYGYSKNDLSVMWSATKTFTATAIAIAADEGLLSLNDKITSFYTREELPANPDGWLGEITIKHLLTMSSGFSDHGAIGKIRTGEWKRPAEKILSFDVEFKPGTRYKYASANTYLLSDIITRLTGMKLMDYLQDRVLIPLGIRRWEFEESADGRQCGGWGLYLTAESLGKLGMLWLQRGVWNGERIISDKWFDEATMAQIYQKGELPGHESFDADDWNSGYGYQVWICTHDSYRIDGAYGQEAIVIPSKNAVVVTTGYIGDKPGMINSIWKNILPLL